MIMRKNIKKLISLGLIALFMNSIIDPVTVFGDQQVSPINQVENSNVHSGPVKPVDTLEQNGPTGFMWADFGTHAVVMTVIIGKPKGDKIPLTILDAHLISDQGTQHIQSELDKAAVAQLLVDGKKAKGTLMIPGSNFNCIE